MDLIVRPAVLDDIPAIQTVALRTWPAAYLPFTPPDYVIGALATWWTADAVRATVERDTTLVAEAGGEVVGTATLGVEGVEQVLWRLYVVPAAQGGGVGSALLRAVIAAADPRRDLLVEFLSDNERARRFYERFGFVAETVAPDEHGMSVTWARRPRAA